MTANLMKSIIFMHIDRHYDMLNCFFANDVEYIRANKGMSYDQFASLRRINDTSQNVCKWDNFIQIGYSVCPNWFQNRIFVTYKEGTPRGNWPGKQMLQINEYEPKYVSSEIEKHILSSSVAKDYVHLPWLVSLDLDFFFPYSEGTSKHVRPDEEIISVARCLQSSMDNIKLLTIALSPDCCSDSGASIGWMNTFRVLKLMSKEMDALKEFPFDEYGL